jgi:histidinol dehydrogenase
MEIFRVNEDAGRERLKKIVNRGGDVLDSETVRLTADIVRAVREQGDAALFRFTERYDGVTLTAQNVRADPALIETLANQVGAELRAHLRQAIENVRLFHERQRESSWVLEQADGVRLEHRIAPLDSVGLYIPGGKAAYPSSVIMNAIPAQTAGVRRVVAVTPANAFMSNPVIAAALYECGVTEVYTVGGAQAVAALAYGTESVPRVDKIVGPGNRFVTAAKQQVYGAVDIDAIAGPSEVVVVADETAHPLIVAADMLAQAEHDPSAAAVCVTTSESLARRVKAEVETQAATLSRRETVVASLNAYGAIFLTETIDEACELVNRLAPEHVEVITANAETVAEKIQFAGAIFIGEASAEAVGDYFAGPSHVLPTGGSARFFSPLGVYDFVRRTNVIRYSYQRLEKTAAAITAIADAEGLDGHARSIRMRMQRHSGPLTPNTQPLPNADRRLLLATDFGES